MSNNIEEVFKDRLSIVKNVGELHKYGNQYQKTSTSGQMSLFGSDETTTKPQIRKFEGKVDKLNMALNEIDLIGLCASYDYMENYLIHKLVYTNSSIRDVDLIDENKKNIIVLGLVNKIEYRTSAAGNKYIKLYIYDEGVEVHIYLSGKKMQEYSGFFTKNSIYLFQLDVTGNGNYINLKSAIKPEASNPSKKFNSIKVEVTDFKYIKPVRDYIHSNMFGSGDKELIFIVEDSEFKAPYKVKISNKDLINLTKMNCKIKLE